MEIAHRLSDAKNRNEQAVLDCISTDGPMSLADISRKVTIKSGTMDGYLKELQRDNSVARFWQGRKLLYSKKVST